MAKIIRLHSFGDPQVLRLEDFEPGNPGKGELRIRQTAIGVNFSDLLVRTGILPVALPSGIGSESAGVIETIGPDTAGFAVGDRVVCVSPTQPAYAEVRLAPAALTMRLPAHISDEAAVAMMTKGLTAHYLITDAFSVRAGDVVLFHSAAGGVGQIACQWLKALGATVIGAVGSENKVAFARAHGCDHVITYNQGKFAHRIRELTGGAGVAVVYDAVGKETFYESLDCLRRRGFMVTYGSSSGPVEPLDLRLLQQKGSLYVTRSGLADYATTREELEVRASALFDAVSSGLIKVEIGRKFALEDAAAAHAHVASRGSVGATVLLP
jgi:NADPH2:quinone reductase